MKFISITAVAAGSTAYNKPEKGSGFKFTDVKLNGLD